MNNPFPLDTPSSEVEIIDKAEPYVQAEIEGMRGWWKVKVKARVRGNDTDELYRVITQAEERLTEKYRSQDKEIKSSE